MERVVGEMVYGERMGVGGVGVGGLRERERERQKGRKREGREDRYENMEEGILKGRNI